MIVAVIYNYPRRNPTNFVDYLKIQLKAISKEKKLVVISGGFNLDLLKYEKAPAIENFLNVLLSSFYQPLILQPSRFTDNSGPTLIYNIFINSIDTAATSGNLIPTISDHMPNFAIMEKAISKIKRSRMKKRDLRTFNHDNFEHDISNIDFSTNTAMADCELEVK